MVVYEPEIVRDGASVKERHGNFFDAAYAAILSKPEWARRLNKAHTGRKDLPRPESGRKWRELDSCMSSDALLMNFFCWAPAARSDAEIDSFRRLLGVQGKELPEFGWKAKVPLKSGLFPPQRAKTARRGPRFDRTEVDMRWGDLSTPQTKTGLSPQRQEHPPGAPSLWGPPLSTPQTKTSLWGPPLLVEAKLTEGDFQTRAATIVEGYRDFDAVFDRELLPRVEVALTRRRQAAEFAEEYSQEWEDTAGLAAEEAGAIAAEYQAGLVAEAEARAPREMRYRSYQLIRNVLAAYAEGARFCVIADDRRPDLKEAWFQVMAAVRSAEMRTRCLMVTWQELAAVAPVRLREFLEVKYGIVAG